MKIENDYIYIKSVSRFYWKDQKIYKSLGDLALDLDLKTDEIKKIKSTGVIKTYEGVCYSYKERPGYYNTLNKDVILKPCNCNNSNNCVECYRKQKDPDNLIYKLIRNLCGNNEDNIQYLEKCILFRYLNPDNYMMPILILHGDGGSGKGLLMQLLGSIFGQDNVHANLSRDHLIGRFAPYKGDKLILEFGELETGNTKEDSIVMSQLKLLAMSEKITVEEKHMPIYKVDNPAWIIITSNSKKPILLDKTTGNRRFSVMKTGKALGLELGHEISEVARNTDPEGPVAKYLRYLFNEYFESINNINNMYVLENQDKVDLEQRAYNIIDIIWQYLIEKFDRKVDLADINKAITQFIAINGIDMNEEQLIRKYIWNDAPLIKKKLDINGVTVVGADFRKNKDEQKELF